MKKDDLKIDQFLNDYRRMSLAPCQRNCVLLKGKFDFIANIEDGQEIEDSYELEISIPSNFSRSLPEVKEIAGKITKENSNGHLMANGSLCLGSRLRQLIKIHENPTLIGFTKHCLIPYLYAISYKMKNGGDLIFGELPHGEEGLIEDYMELLGLSNVAQFFEAIRLLGLKRRIANKKKCPCGCSQRLGACQFNLKLDKLRKVTSPSWFRTKS